MTFINYAAREINCKIVYYGPGLCGKTTNLQWIYDKTNPQAKGKLISLATETDRTLFFDFLPLDLGTAGPGPLPVDQLGLEQTDRGLHQRVVQGVTDRADRPGDPGLEQCLGERQRRVLRPSIGVMDQTGRGEGGVAAAAGEQRLL